MSEKIYAALLHIYPAPFREAYGDDALQLFRDRSRNEQGLIPQLRLWLDLLFDLIASAPFEYRRAQPAFVASAPPGLNGAPSFLLLENAAPRLSAQFCAGLLSLAAFFAILVAIGNGWNYRFLRAWFAELPPHGDARPPQSKAAMLPASFAFAQSQVAQPLPQDATRAIVEAFKTHDVVMFGEWHANKQEYEWLCSLVGAPEFDDRVDDIVVEFGNSLYQKSVDRYIAGEDVPIEQVRKAWRNVIGSVGPPSPVYEQFYKAVRDANIRRHGKHQLRILLGDPYGDWEKIKDAEGLGPYLTHRDEWYAQVVKDEVLARHHRALLIMGSGHFIRRNGPGLVERNLRADGAIPYLVVFGTNVVGGYDDLDHRFDAWPAPAIVSLAGNWVGDLPAMPVINGGTTPATPLKLADAADALLYIGPRDSLTELRMPRSELDGTPYGNELNRRLMIFPGHPINFLYDQTEVPQFNRPQPRPQSGLQPNQQAGPAARPMMPPPPKSMNDPLPPRPPSQ
jgi:hypothetical protein